MSTGKQHLIYVFRSTSEKPFTSGRTYGVFCPDEVPPHLKSFSRPARQGDPEEQPKRDANFRFFVEGAAPSGGPGMRLPSAEHSTHCSWPDTNIIAAFVWDARSGISSVLSDPLHLAGPPPSPLPPSLWLLSEVN